VRGVRHDVYDRRRQLAHVALVRIVLIRTAWGIFHALTQHRVAVDSVLERYGALGLAHESNMVEIL
jgi:hypothetical protein